jgi:NADH dehydrogenase/putative oxidoreductase
VKGAKVSLKNWMWHWHDARSALQGGIADLFDLALRIALGQAFLVSALLKLSNWDTALFLSEYEYPVPWLDPGLHAAASVSIELGGAIALVLGLGTRVAAAAMAALTLSVQVYYRELDLHLAWLALFAWWIAHGAGRFSLDRVLAPGLSRSPLPGASALIAAIAGFSGIAEPPIRLALRAWLAAAVLAGAQSAMPPALHAWLPSGAVAPLPLWLAAALALLLASGTATRPAALLLAAVAWLSAAPGAGLALACVGALLALRGAGAWSLDALIERALKRIFPQLEGKPAFSLKGLPRVVIVGAGFGGLACAARLKQAAVSVTLIDRHNYHLFQPLLYQVATASLAPADIAAPIRGMFRGQFNARVLLGEVGAIDTAAREVHVGDVRVGYDFLVLATGASHSYFGRDEWAPYAPGLKRVEDATEVRARVLSAFERAESVSDSAEQRRLLTFLVVGGGPTGVELAGAIAELARFGMEKDFRNFDPAQARVLLVQAGPRLLPAFDPSLSQRAREALESVGVEVLTDSRVEKIDASGVTVSGKRIDSRTVLWAAGVVASPAARWLGTPADSAGRVLVQADLSVPGRPGVFAIGDTAAAKGPDGAWVPGLAPAAKQGGAYVADLILSRVEGLPLPGPFRYRHLGSLATIGRKAAVADFGLLRLSGAPAWWLWGLIHVGFLVGMRNRVSVMLDWMWSYLTYRSGSRLITARPAAPAPTESQLARASGM